MYFCNLDELRTKNKQDLKEFIEAKTREINAYHSELEDIFNKVQSFQRSHQHLLNKRKEQELVKFVIKSPLTTHICHDEEE